HQNPRAGAVLRHRSVRLRGRSGAHAGAVGHVSLLTDGNCPVAAKRRIRVARIYDEIDPDEGQRVLVDRIWPRGIRKDDPRVGIWLKDVAPSKELRERYHHEPERFDEFAARTRRSSPATRRSTSCAGWPSAASSPWSPPLAR